jgi:uncharacterized protein
MPPVKSQLAIIQPTPFCNINCRYCYLPDRLSTKRISFETLSKIGERLFASPFVSGELTIVWHAGEPLVMPVQFYERAFEVLQQQNKNSVDLIFSFQTNATLINQKWCDFFKRYDCRVGISLDGPKYIHDLHRVDRAGKGTFDRAFRGLKLLQEAGLRPSVIMVVTKDALSYPEEIWRFFRENNIDLVGFNPEEIEGVNTASTMHNDDAETAYKAFLKRVLALGVDTPRLREYESTMQFIRAKHSAVHAHDNVPMAIISFDCYGNISTFSPELLTAHHAPYGTFTFGNVFEHSLEEVFQNDKFRAVNGAIQQGVEECRTTCDYYRFCGGGSPSNKILENGSFASTETRSCRLRIKTTVSAVVEHLEQRYSTISQ